MKDKNMKEIEKTSQMEKGDSNRTSQLYRDVINTKPRFANSKEAVTGLTQELEAIAAEFKMSIEELFLEAEHSPVFKDGHLRVLALTRQISFHKKKAAVEK